MSLPTKKKTSTKNKKPKFVPEDFKLKVKRSHAGLGLYTLEDIPKGSCVIEYVGRTLEPGEDETITSQYLFEITKTKTIDGKARSNTARYINHSHRPNCEIEIYKEHVYVMARRGIKAGEELGYDYGSSFYNEYIKPKGCKCVKCRPDLHDAAKVKAKK